ncbi:MAG TPA: DedA family protein [Acidimicrobiia bacterium]
MTLADLGFDPEQLIRHVGLIGLFLIVFAESGILIGFFLPGDSLLFTAGLLVATAVMATPLPLVILGCAVAAIVGDQVGYAFGHRYGPGLFTRPDSRLLKQEQLARAEDFFERHGAKTVVLARFVPFVRTFAPIVAGASTMHYRKFTIYNIVGGTLWVATVTTLGWALGTRFPGIADYLDVAILVIVGSSIVLIVAEYLRRRAHRAS